MYFSKEVQSKEYLCLDSKHLLSITKLCINIVHYITLLCLWLKFCSRHPFISKSSFENDIHFLFSYNYD
jgi:hypothetical protein